MTPAGDGMSTPTRDVDPRSIQELVTDAVADVRAIIADEKELAQAELKVTGIRAGAGAGLIGATTGLLFFASIPFIIFVAELFVRFGLPRWGAYLLTWGTMIFIALVLAGIAFLLLRRIGPPRRAISAGRQTADLIRTRLATFGRAQPTAHPPTSTAGLVPAGPPAGTSGRSSSTVSA
jgi:hypothetical protein